MTTCEPPARRRGTRFPEGQLRVGRTSRGLVDALPRHGLIIRCHERGERVAAPVPPDQIVFDRLKSYAPVSNMLACVSIAWCFETPMTTTSSPWHRVRRADAIVSGDLDLREATGLRMEVFTPREARPASPNDRSCSVSVPWHDGTGRLLAVTNGQRFRRSQHVCRHSRWSAEPRNQNYDI